jgi:hypothetical protein
MLADWNSLTWKPILIAEFGYRGSDSGMPNTIPPAVVTLPTQAERAHAVANYADVQSTRRTSSVSTGLNCSTSRLAADLMARTRIGGS